MNLLKQIHLLTEADDLKKVDKAPLFKPEEKTSDETDSKDNAKTDKSASEPEPEADDTQSNPDDSDSNTDTQSTQDSDTQDVGTIVAQQGFEKESREMFAFGKTRKVTVLTKTEPLGGLEVTYQYLINPKTGSWTLRACLKGQSDEDMVEFHKGEDPASLIDSLKKSQRITPEQAVNNLNPPADPKAE